MSMGLAVICTRTTGQTDTIIDGRTGRYVSPGDGPGLRVAIEELLADPSEALRLGTSARQHVVATADVRSYGQRIGHVLELVRSGSN
jgi:glycosyltransferase involved in cell wall biosynthesis